MREITTIAYEAFDGTLFDSEWECADYERENMNIAFEGAIFKNRMLTVLTLDEVKRDPDEVFYFKTLNPRQFKLVESLVPFRENNIVSEGLEMIYLPYLDAWYDYAEYVAECEEELAKAKKWGE